MGQQWGAAGGESNGELLPWGAECSIPLKPCLILEGSTACAHLGVGDLRGSALQEHQLVGPVVLPWLGLWETHAEHVNLLSLEVHPN